MSHFARVAIERVTLLVLNAIAFSSLLKPALTNPYYIHYRCLPRYMTVPRYLINEIFHSNAVQGKGRIIVPHISYYQRG